MTGKQKRNLRRILLSAALLVCAFVAERIFKNLPLWGILFCYLPAYAVAGYDVLWRALRGIFRGRLLDENFLMALATVGAFAVGFLPSGEAEFAEASFVMIFYQTGELFQSVAVGKSRRSIAQLMNIRPDMARVLRNGEEVEVEPTEVAVGETLVIRPGEKIPLDATLLSGESDISTLALTGEALPRSVFPGDKLMSGCNNLSGKIIARADKVYGESTVAKLLALMENSASKKAKSEKFITRFAAYYTPAVVGAALLLAFLPPLFSQNFQANFPVWFTRALTFLVVSCPCALVIAVPLSFFGGIGGASRFGVLFKGADGLENLAQVTVAAFDKTGTLTKGSFAVSEVYAVENKEKLLWLAASAERDSNHPIALALKNAVGEDTAKPTKVREVHGKGLIAEIEGKECAVGNLLLMKEKGITCTPYQGAGTAVYVAEAGEYKGYVLLCDSVKENAASSLNELVALGVSHRIMLTGDNKAVAESVAKSLPLTSYRAELLPADKVREIEMLLAVPCKGKLLFAGDGINDAPVLARADVGVAMGGLGSDAAIEAADVVLTDDDLSKLPRAVRHAKRTCAIVRQNILFALTVKGIVLLGSALGLFGSLQMPLAVFADVGVAVLAILNAMRTLRAK